MKLPSKLTYGVAELRDRIPNADCCLIHYGESLWRQDGRYVALSKDSWVDYPIRYQNGKVAYDNPERFTQGFKGLVNVYLRKRVEQLRQIVKNEEVSVEHGATEQFDEMNNVIVETATCGICGLSWNDALISSRTPVPSGRCPYEYIHAEVEELKRLGGRQ